jgi:hypothetical protein
MLPSSPFSQCEEQSHKQKVYLWDLLTPKMITCHTKTQEDMELSKEIVSR